MKSDTLKMMIGQIAASADYLNSVLQFTMKNMADITEVIDHLEQREIPLFNINASPTFLEINITGGKSDYIRFLRAMGEIGYRRDTLPDENEKFVSVYGVMTREETKLRVWVYFSSTSCKKVKTGTKTVEQDVYDIVCEDTADV